MPADRPAAALTVDALPAADLRARLRGPGVRLDLGPMVARVRSPLAGFAETFRLLYGDWPLAGPDQFTDVTCDLRPVWALRHAPHRRVQCLIDGQPTFETQGTDFAPLLFEWALNLHLANHGLGHKMFHAAVVARGDDALILPAPSGSGKSTLAAALVASGRWRLLSDEFAVVGVDDGLLHPLPRPVSLKNDMPRLLRRLDPGARFAATVPTAHKGPVTLMRPPAASVAARGRPARARWLVTPRYTPGGDDTLRPQAPGRAMMGVLEQCFEWGLRGRRDFDLIADLVGACACFTLAHGDLGRAVAAVERMADAAADATTAEAAA